MFAPPKLTLGGTETAYGYETVTGSARTLCGAPRDICVADHEPFQFVKLSDADARRIDREFGGRDYIYMLTTPLVATLRAYYDDGAEEDIPFTIPAGFLSDGASAVLRIGEPPYPRLAFSSAWSVGWWVHDAMYQTTRLASDVAAPRFERQRYVRSGDPVGNLELTVFYAPAEPAALERFRVACDSVLIFENRSVTSTILGEDYFASGLWGAALPAAVGKLDQYGTHLTTLSVEQLVANKKGAVFKYDRNGAMDMSGLFESIKNDIALALSTSEYLPGCDGAKAAATRPRRPVAEAWTDAGAPKPKAPRPEPEYPPYDDDVNADWRGDSAGAATVP